MENFRKYGKMPFRVVVVHGGPGAAGEMAVVARELAGDFGVVEPLQTKDSIDIQVKELKSVLEKEGDLPVCLIGFSWGAWLSFILTATYPELVRKLILVSAGPFREKYVDNIMKTRLSRMDDIQRQEMISLSGIFRGNDNVKKQAAMIRFGELMFRADSFAPLHHLRKESEIEVNYDIYEKVQQEAETLRKSGELLELGRKITCPVVAIHGDYDPHPYKGVKDPLALMLKDFKFILLEKCGHEPFLERYAKDAFYVALRNELNPE